MKYLILVIFLSGCAGLPKLSLTPVSADLAIGGEHETGVKEDNMVKVQTGDSAQTDYTADLVTQTYNDIQEYPEWLIMCFALAVGLALPSPVSSWGNWRQRRALTKQVDSLTKLLAQSHPTHQPIKEPHHGSTTNSNTRATG